MSIQRSTRSVLTPALVAVPLWLWACGGTSGPSTSTSTAEIGPNTPYFVLPVQAEDGTLPPAVNDPGPCRDTTPEICAATGALPLTAKDCAPPDGIEIAIMDDYEAGKARQTYTYNDSTCEVMPVPLKDWEPAATPIPAAWGGKRCDSLNAMHLAGKYADWGAGIASLIMYHADTLNPDPSNPRIPINPVAPLYDDAPPIPYVPNFSAADLSAWDGITFWARRGPYGESGFRPSILDRTTAGDLNKHLPPDKALCRSVYTVCSCLNGKPCTHWNPATDPGPDPVTIPQTGCFSGFAASAPEVEGDYCWDPKVDKWPSNDATLRCGQTACDYRPNDSPVPTMIFNPLNHDAATLYAQGPAGGITCSPEPYVFKDSTLPSARFCYRPGIDADPPEKADRCENNWLGSQPVDTNWKRYMIPFADMRQDNTAPKKRSPGMDLTAVEVLSLVFPAGNLDVWIDDLGFYRKKK